ncbi:flagellar basal body P-ring protein FlgI [bacterium]|jgi:flagellar P-ring protein FlgI|nr:flagellar basal body P-ring protein FlgI [bacterium]
MKKNFLTTLLLMILIVTTTAQPVTTGGQMRVRVKDVGSIVESRDNQLIGFGLVVGLRNTGDTRSSKFTHKALTNLLKKMGIAPNSKSYTSRNVAAVMVTTNLPPYLKRGQRIAVTVSSLGDATSLEGGTLLMTPLQGPDFKTYAVAQGPVIVGGISGQAGRSNFVKNQTTVGRVPDGAIVEVEVAVSREDQQNVTIVLEKANFITAARVAKALTENGFKGTIATDPATIKIPLATAGDLPFAEIIAKIENTLVRPDGSSKVVVNSRTGTVIIGEMVRLFPVAITHGNISVKIDGIPGEQYNIYVFDAESKADISIQEPKAKIAYLAPKENLSSLVDALNELGVTPKDLISIIQALKESGALIADIEVI